MCKRYTCTSTKPHIPLVLLICTRLLYFCLFYYSIYREYIYVCSKCILRVYVARRDRDFRVGFLCVVDASRISLDYLIIVRWIEDFMRNAADVLHVRAQLLHQQRGAGKRTHAVRTTCCSGRCAPAAERQCCVCLCVGVCVYVCVCGWVGCLAGVQILCRYTDD